MGVAELRDAFNVVVHPRFACAKATLRYERRDGAEVQVLGFSGTDQDGGGFYIEERAPGGADPVAEAKVAAKKLLARKDDAP